MLNGTHKKLSNLVLNFAAYLWDTTLEYCRSGYLPKGPIVSDSLAVVEIRQTL
jgi:hypothetical protein